MIYKSDNRSHKTIHSNKRQSHITTACCGAQQVVANALTAAHTLTVCERLDHRVSNDKWICMFYRISAAECVLLNRYQTSSSSSQLSGLECWRKMGMELSSVCRLVDFFFCWLSYKLPIICLFGTRAEITKREICSLQRCKSADLRYGHCSPARVDGQLETRVLYAPCLFRLCCLSNSMRYHVYIVIRYPTARSTNQTAVWRIHEINLNK